MTDFIRAIALNRRLYVVQHINKLLLRNELRFVCIFLDFAVHATTSAPIVSRARSTTASPQIPGAAAISREA